VVCYNTGVARPVNYPAKRENNKPLEFHMSPVQAAVVRLYAAGRPRAVIAKLLGPKVYPKMPENLAIKSFRAQIIRWEDTQWFRDAVYDQSMAKLDVDSAKIMRAVSNRAQRGRVDAARLAFELTGRHNPRGEQAAAAIVQINLQSPIPRPVGRPSAQLELDPVDETVDE